MADRDDWTVEPATVADADAIAQIHRLAFGGPAEADLVTALALEGAVALSLVVRSPEDGRAIGHALWSVLGGPLRALALAPVAVLPGRQGRGAGSAAISAGLMRAQSAGWQAAFVLGEPGFYGRFGFSRAAARGYDCPYQGDYFLGRVWDAAAPRSGELVYARAFQAL